MREPSLQELLDQVSAYETKIGRRIINSNMCGRRNVIGEGISQPDTWKRK